MMKNFRNIIFIFSILVFFSCSSKKNILYVQDIDEKSNIKFEYSDYKIKIGDILKIDIITDNQEVSLQFNPKVASSNVNNTKDAILYNGFQVDALGYINFPTIGKIKALDKSFLELRDYMYNYITEKKYLNNPFIDIKHINSHFTVIGEVNKPGRYDFLDTNMNILKAIGLSGDLTINGKRNDIKLIREIEGEQVVSSIDLTTSDFINAGSFQIFSGDIIIVNPNSARVKNAGIIGNSGTLLSLLSFLLSSIIIINN